MNAPVSSDLPNPRVYVLADPKDAERLSTVPQEVSWVCLYLDTPKTSISNESVHHYVDTVLRPLQNRLKSGARLPPQYFLVLPAEHIASQCYSALKEAASKHNTAWIEAPEWMKNDLHSMANWIHESASRLYDRRLKPRASG